MEDPRGKAVHSAQPQLSLSQGFKLKGCRGCPGPLGLSGDPPPHSTKAAKSARGSPDPGAALLWGLPCSWGTWQRPGVWGAADEMRGPRHLGT